MFYYYLLNLCTTEFLCFRGYYDHHHVLWRRRNLKRSNGLAIFERNKEDREHVTHIYSLFYGGHWKHLETASWWWIKSGPLLKVLGEGSRGLSRHLEVWVTGSMYVNFLISPTSHVLKKNSCGAELLCLYFQEVLIFYSSFRYSYVHLYPNTCIRLRAHIFSKWKLCVC